MGTQSSPKESTGSCHMFQIDHRQHKFEDLTWCGRQWGEEGRQEKEPGEDCAATWAAVFQFLSFRAHKTCIKVMKIYWLPIKATRSFAIATSSPSTLYSPPPPRATTCWQLHAVQYLFNLPRAANKKQSFFRMFSGFSFAFHTFHAKMNRKKTLRCPDNFSCSPPWKIVFQSRKHSWNFIASCFY